MKIREIMETYRHRDFQYGSVSAFKLFYGLFQTEIVDILHAGHVHVFFEETHEVVFTEIAKPGKL